MRPNICCDPLNQPGNCLENVSSEIQNKNDETKLCLSRWKKTQNKLKVFLSLVCVNTLILSWFFFVGNSKQAKKKSRENPLDSYFGQRRIVKHTFLHGKENENLD